MKRLCRISTPRYHEKESKTENYGVRVGMKDDISNEE